MSMVPKAPDPYTMNVSQGRAERGNPEFLLIQPKDIFPTESYESILPFPLFNLHGSL